MSEGMKVLAVETGAVHPYKTRAEYIADATTSQQATVAKAICKSKRNMDTSRHPLRE